MADTPVTTGKYYTIITDTGKAKIAAAILSGEKVTVTHIAVGDGGGAYYTPSHTQTGLVRECWRGEIAWAEVNGADTNIIDIMGIVPADVGGFTVREGCAIDDEGDVIALWNTPDAQKTTPEEGAVFPLDVVAHIVVEDASAVHIVVNPSLDTVSRADLQTALSRLGSTMILEGFTIPAKGWAAGSAAFEDYGYAIDVAAAEATAQQSASLALAALETASAAKLCPTCRVVDGAVRFWAKKPPAADITGTLTLFEERRTSGSGGGESTEGGGSSGGTGSCPGNCIGGGITASDDGAGTVTLTMIGVTTSYDNGTLKLS